MARQAPAGIAASEHVSVSVQQITALTVNCSPLCCSFRWAQAGQRTPMAKRPCKT